MIDLRSDTVTKPTTEMRKVMVKAEVGDDVFGEDPSAKALEEKMARMFDFEAGLFVPSGTMGNQLSINVLTDPGDEVLIEETGHIINYESTAAAHLSSVQLTPIRGDKGKISVDSLRDRLRGTYDWEPRTKVISVENSTNKGGGCCYTEEELQKIRTFANKHNMEVHLDGARIWNAMTATETSPEFYGSVADTLSVCFSKGLGAPVGSMILSTQMEIDQARRMRKMWGGGMRQIGILAAAADYAIEEHLSLLQDDHRRARELAETIEECPDLAIELDSVETNILIFEVLDESAVSAVGRLEQEGILLVPFGPNTLRATFHFQVTDQDMEQVKSVFENCFG